MDNTASAHVGKAETGMYRQGVSWELSLEEVEKVQIFKVR